jgi:hypothetical protein
MERKQLFLDLMENPEMYFGKGVKLVLFPNGRHEIWLSAGPHGFRVTAGMGRAGLALNVERFVGGTAMTVSGNRCGDYEVTEQIDMSNVSICQYSNDERSQAFKQWYGLRHKPEEHGPAYYQGRLAAQTLDEPPERVLIENDSVIPGDRIGFLAGFWAQKAGLHDDGKKAPPKPGRKTPDQAGADSAQ